MTRKRKTYRHTPAFLLLFLSEKDYYGAALLNTLQSDLPAYKTDGAIIYRALKELVELEAVEFYWDTSNVGPAQKWYRITDVGYEMLKNYKEDIIKRKKNFEYFLEKYDENIK